MRTLRRRRGFSMLELLVVIAVIAILITLLLPAVQQARESARRMQCRHYITQLGIALANYQHAHRVLPSGCVSPSGPVVTGGNYNRISWIVQILPFIGEEAVYRHVDFARPELSFLTRKGREGYLAARARWRVAQGKAGSETELQPEASSPSQDPMPDQPVETETDAVTEQAGMDPLANGAVEDLQTLQDISSVPPDPRTFGPVGLVRIAILHCPSYSGGNTSKNDMSHPSNYAACHASTEVSIDADNDGLLFLNSSQSLRSIPDGAANTILIGEHLFEPLGDGWFFGDRSTLRNGGAKFQASEQLARIQRKAGLDQLPESELSEEERAVKKKAAILSGPFGSQHSHVNFVFADGSQKPISFQINRDVFRRLCSRNDGRLVSGHEF